MHTHRYVRPSNTERDEINHIVMDEFATVIFDIDQNTIHTRVGVQQDLGA
jgi:hypothetical protein